MNVVVFKNWDKRERWIERGRYQGRLVLEHVREDPQNGIGSDRRPSPMYDGIRAPVEKQTGLGADPVPAATAKRLSESQEMQEGEEVGELRKEVRELRKEVRELIKGQGQVKQSGIPEQGGAGRKDPEYVQLESKNHASLVQEIKAFTSAELSKMTKVSRILLRVSGDLAELIISHDYQNASSAIIATQQNFSRIEDNFPDMNFEHIYVFDRYFKEEYYHNFIDVNA